MRGRNNEKTPAARPQFGSWLPLSATACGWWRRQTSGREGDEQSATAEARGRTTTTAATAARRMKKRECRISSCHVIFARSWPKRHQKWRLAALQLVFYSRRVTSTEHIARLNLRSASQPRSIASILSTFTPTLRATKVETAATNALQTELLDPLRACACSIPMSLRQILAMTATTIDDDTRISADSLMSRRSCARTRSRLASGYRASLLPPPLAVSMMHLVAG